jgi:hypothetical protein
MTDANYDNDEDDRRTKSIAVPCSLMQYDVFNYYKQGVGGQSVGAWSLGGIYSGMTLY